MRWLVKVTVSWPSQVTSMVFWLVLIDEDVVGRVVARMYK